MSFSLISSEKSNFDVKKINAAKISTYLNDLASFDEIEQSLVQQGVLPVPENNIITEVILKKLLKVIEFHFLQDSELNEVDHPEWMVHFLSTVLKENLDAFLDLKIKMKHIVRISDRALREFVTKLSARFK
jgi:hypothetical protein